MKISFSNIIAVIGAIAAIAIQWGVFGARLQAQEVKTAEVASVKEAIPAILARLNGMDESLRDIKRDVRELRNRPTK